MPSELEFLLMYKQCKILLTLGACARVTVVVLCVCVCVCVCYRVSRYIPRLYVESRVPLGFLC